MTRAGQVNSPVKIDIKYPKILRIPEPGSALVRKMEKNATPSAVSRHNAVT